MKKPIHYKLTRIPLGFGIIIIVILMIVMFLIGILIGYLLNHQNPLEFFDFHTWKHFKQLFGG